MKKLTLVFILIVFFVHSGCSSKSEVEASYEKWVEECRDYQARHRMRGYSRPEMDFALGSKNLKSILRSQDGVIFLQERYRQAVAGEPVCDWDFFLNEILKPNPMAVDRELSGQAAGVERELRH